MTSIIPSVKKAFFWSGIEQLGPQLVSFIISIVLARLLEPADFGLVGMMALFIGLAHVFTNSGLSAALIQRKTLTLDDETSAFALNIVVGGGLAILLCLISPFVAGFYKKPILLPLLCVNSLTVIISSFTIVQSALLTRNMMFKQTAVISTISSIVSGLTGISMAYLDYGVWSLLGASISAGLVRTGLYWKMSQWRPTGKVKWQCIRSMWGYSSNLLGCSLIGVTYQNMYSQIIGKVYSPESLGYYNRANSLRMLPAEIISGIVNRVAFPLFSRYQEDKPLLLKRVREIIRGTLLVSAGGLTLLAVIADPLIPLLLTEKWRTSIHLLRILCYAGVFYPVSVLYLMTLQAQGYSNLNLRLENIKMVIGLITVTVVYRYGVTALAWSVVALTVNAYFLNAWYNVKLLNYHWRMQAYDILPTFLLCLISGWAAWWIANLFPLIPLGILFVKSGVFLVFLGLSVYLLRKSFYEEFWSHLAWGISKILGEQKKL